MQGKTRSQKPKLALGLEKSVNRQRLSRVVKIVERVDVNIESCLNVEPLINPLVEVVEVHTQIEEEDLPSNSSRETFDEVNIIREEVFERTSEVSKEGFPITMDLPYGSGIPPPPIPHFLPIDPLVKPKGLPIIVPQGMASVDIPSNPPKIYGTKDEDLSRHMKRFIERVISSLITNQGYWLVWFPSTLEGEAYEWYRFHDDGHFRTWNQLQREFLNEFRPEVSQSMPFRALMNIRQGKEEEVSAYIRRFDWMCARYVGTLLNDDTFKQFFMQRFVKAGTIRGVLKRTAAHWQRLRSYVFRIQS